MFSYVLIHNLVSLNLSILHSSCFTAYCTEQMIPDFMMFLLKFPPSFELAKFNLDAGHKIQARHLIDTIEGCSSDALVLLLNNGSESNSTSDDCPVLTCALEIFRSAWFSSDKIQTPLACDTKASIAMLQNYGAIPDHEDIKMAITARIEILLSDVLG